MDEIIIRSATPQDAQAILDIYRYYVEHTAISFEITVPTVSEIQRRIGVVLTAFPYLIAQKGDSIIGYAYAGPFIKREAYDHCAEVSIYISRECRKSGVGKMLYSKMFRLLEAQGIVNIYACIGVPEEPDEYLNNNSAEFHQHMGFTEVGRFHHCGRKFGRSYHMIWMEKIIQSE